MSSAGILNLPITSLPVDNFHDWALWCKSTGINYNMHGWILCRYCATGWFWWISGLRAVTMWSSSSFTKTFKNFEDENISHIPPFMHRSYMILTVVNNVFTQLTVMVVHRPYISVPGHCFSSLNYAIMYKICNLFRETSNELLPCFIFLKISSPCL